MIEAYINYLNNIKGYSYNTAIAYERDIRNFASWLKQQNEEARWSTVTRDDVDKYISEQTEKGLKPSTTNREIAAISSLYNYFQRQGLKVANPCKYESRKKVEDKVPNTIEMASLKLAYENARGVARFMLGILSTTGIRIQELLDLTWEDINFETAQIIIKGKGAKERVVYTTAKVLDYYRELYTQTNPSGQIFFIKQRTARIIIWQALKPFTRAKQLSPHAIRHTYATELAKQGFNVSYIQQALGHTHISTTQKYINTAEIARRGNMISLI